MDKTKPFTQLNIDALKALRCLSGSSILVYISLRIYGGKDSTAWPSQDRISKDLGMPIATVRKAFAQLRKAELEHIRHQLSGLVNPELIRARHDQIVFQLKI